MEAQSCTHRKQDHDSPSRMSCGRRGDARRLLEKSRDGRLRRKRFILIIMIRTPSSGAIVPSRAFCQLNSPCRRPGLLCLTRRWIARTLGNWDTNDAGWWVLGMARLGVAAVTDHVPPAAQPLNVSPGRVKNSGRGRLHPTGRSGLPSGRRPAHEAPRSALAPTSTSGPALPERDL